MKTIPDSFLQKLVTQLDDDNTIGLTLSGSLSRGEGGRYSDVDIHRYVRRIPETKVEADSLRFMDAFLVSIHTYTVEDETTGLRDPHRALWVVPGLRQARILLDKDGSLTGLVKSAKAFRWSDLQPAADTMVSWQLCYLAEEVYKILDGLATGNESKVTYALFSLLLDIAEVLLVQRGVFVPTENAYFELAQSAAGRDSAWTRQLRLATGLDPVPADQPVYVTRGVAALNLYRLTVELMGNILRPEDSAVIHHTLEAIKEAGY
jgi:hypothetical protein